MKRVMIVAPHPDDETLGCGGVICNHLEKGDEVYWVIVTNISESQGWSAEKVQTRAREINEVASFYGFTATIQLNFPTTRLDEIPRAEIIQQVSTHISEIQPEVLYLPNRSDVHTDHQVVFDVFLSCSKQFRYPSVKRILMYETCSETEFSAALPEKAFLPNVYCDITPYIEQKMEAMAMFSSEVMPEPFPRSLGSIKALARWRGSRIGVEYAESFSLVLDIYG